MPHIALAETDEEIGRCFAVMSQLRPHLVAAEFVSRVRSMQAEGYRLAALEDDKGVVGCVAGFRIMDMLVSGRVLYVDDLVSDSASRSHGYGAAMLAWLAERATEAACVTLQLDSGTHRHDAHRFYFRERMHISSFHFTRKL
jgi:GNAT superfamily N-acetyltransferase